MSKKKINSEESSDFDIDAANSSLEKFCADQNALDLESFLNAYKELRKYVY